TTNQPPTKKTQTAAPPHRANRAATTQRNPESAKPPTTPLVQATLCSSAISTRGGPPLQIVAACASVSFPPAEAKHACSTSSEGKWTSTIRWNGGPPCGEPWTLVATSLVLPASFLAAIGTCSS